MRVWRIVFGKPDGWVPRLRCRLLGHDWHPCIDVCCDGRMIWCDRCFGSREAAA